MWRKLTILSAATILAVTACGTAAFARDSRRGDDRGRVEQPNRDDHGSRDRQRDYQRDRHTRYGRDRAEQRKIDSLIDELRHGSKNERRDAASELGAMAAHEAIPALSEALLNDPDERVRQNAAHAFLRIGDDRALPVLRRAAEHDRSKKVRREAEISIKDILENPPAGGRPRYKAPERDRNRHGDRKRQPERGRQPDRERHTDSRDGGGLGNLLGGLLSSIHVQISC